MIMGKNTLMKASLSALNTKPNEEDSDYESRGGANWAKDDNVDKIITQLKGNSNIIFTNGDLGDIKTILDKEIRPSPAKPGMIAPADVWIQPGATGLDPKNTSFF
jgi:ribosomal protein L10